VRVKAVARVKVTVGGFLDGLRPSRTLDDIKDLIGRSLELQLVSAELDASKHTIPSTITIRIRACTHILLHGLVYFFPGISIEHTHIRASTILYSHRT
jgi:hypothetical protein